MSEYTQFSEEQISEINALVTERINKFHDALLERGQITPPPPAEDPVYQPLQQGL